MMKATAKIFGILGVVPSLDADEIGAACLELVGRTDGEETLGNNEVGVIGREVLGRD